MNTAVGIMQTEQIGRIKKSFVGKSYSITAGDTLLGAGQAVYSGLDGVNVRHLMQDYDEYVDKGNIGSSKSFSQKQRYAAIREHIDWEKIKQQSGGDRAKAEQLLRKAYWDKNTGR